MKEIQGVEGEAGYYYKQATKDELEIEKKQKIVDAKSSRTAGYLTVVCIITVVFLICTTILLYKILCSGGAC